MKQHIVCASVFFFLILPIGLFAQESKAPSTTNWTFAPEGMLGFSVGQHFYSINVGGPSFLIPINRRVKIGIGAFPSLYVHNSKLGARLGVSPRIEFGNFVFIAPFFHKDASNVWISSVGLAYRFHAKK